MTPALLRATHPPLHLQAWKLAGAVAFLPHLLAVLVAAAQRPGFSHRTQFLSELGERGSSTASLANYLGILPTGALLACFGLGLVAHYRADRRLALGGALIVVHGLCRMLAAFFTCDPGCRPDHPSMSQAVHNVVAGTAFVALTAALFTIGAWLIVHRRGAAIIAASYALGLLALVSQALLVFHGHGNSGLYQRMALAALQLWVTVLALHLLRPAPAAGAGA